MQVNPQSSRDSANANKEMFNTSIRWDFVEVWNKLRTKVSASKWSQCLEARIFVRYLRDKFCSLLHCSHSICQLSLALCNSSDTVRHDCHSQISWFLEDERHPINITCSISLASYSVECEQNVAANVLFGTVATSTSRHFR